jgi:predicted DNA binding CopG/RHH family protein
MRKLRLTGQERIIEDDLVKGEYRDIDSLEFSKIAESLAIRRKDAVLHIRINSADLSNIKNKAQKLGVKYQTFISEVLHRLSKA